MTALDHRALRTAFGSFMTGVTIVTTLDQDGTPLGFTANSFTSVSLDPPLLLVCLAKSSRNYAVFTNTRHFAVNILSEDQIALSNTFARPVAERFAGINWQAGSAGSPLLPDVSAWFDCQMHDVVDAGDHAILLGKVIDFDTTAAPGLGYAQGAYVTPSLTAQAAEPATNLVVSALVEREGEVLLVDDGQGGLTLPESLVGKEGTTAALTKLIDGIGLEAQPGFVYSVFEDVTRGRQHISFLCQAAAGTPTQGAFVPLGSRGFDDITDPAILTMLERLSEEARIGSFGIYYGDQTHGTVQPVARER